ncbi:gamma carbonic anhydrase family protein [Methanocella conradii]|uniref:gamma carbonic anhydrase family protein n=1 Tax=Methanocella conradii TaxID=1175444 RepID=UPI00157D82CA|nr:gamma carbonic anhydrase family protein [Methanocella conradii]
MIFDGLSRPRLAETAFVAETACIVGDVRLEEECSVWYGAVLRGDEASITVGRRANVQDNAVIHADKGEDVLIGEGVTIGHGAIIHGCTIGNYSLIGMGAIILSKAKIGERCIIGAGAVVKEGDVVPDGSLVVGVPGKIIKKLTPEQARRLEYGCEEYVRLARKYKEAMG